MTFCTSPQNFYKVLHFSMHQLSMLQPSSPIVVQPHLAFFNVILRVNNLSLSTTYYNLVIPASHKHTPHPNQLIPTKKSNLISQIRVAEFYFYCLPHPSLNPPIKFFFVKRNFLLALFEKW